MLNDLQVFRGDDVAAALTGREKAIIETVRAAYMAHAAGNCVLPHSSFLRFDEGSPDRIIALPAYVKSPREATGIKWISSVPSNLDRGLDRASGIIVMNDRATGRAVAVLEGSIISAKRTAASAALAASVLCNGIDAVTTAGLIGLGVINHEVLRFLQVTFPALRLVRAYDVNPDRSVAFARKVRQELRDVDIEAAGSTAEVLASCNLISIATTATRPHIDSIDGVADDAVLLHVSLRDLSVDAILTADNVVDDVDHVCRAQTSVHLASERLGHRGFMRSIASVLAAPEPRPPGGRPTIFSPFGLGSLDVAVAAMLLTEAEGSRAGTTIPSFHPRPWQER